jgi:ferritin
MLSKTLLEAINDQINHELYSAYTYLSMSAYFESVNLQGCAHWMKLQGHEEVEHAMKFFDFVHDRGGRVVLDAIGKPTVEFKSPLDAFQQALGHERRVTALIHKIYDLAVKEKDYATQALLNWFVTEQVEEEKSASDVVEQLKLIGDNTAALLLLDQQLGERKAEA